VVKAGYDAMTFKKIILGLIYFGLILTPIFGVQEYLDAFPAFGEMIGPSPLVVVKALKDSLLISIMILFLIDLSKGGKILRNSWLWLMIILIGISFLNTLLYEPLLAMIGLRVFSPFIFIFVSYRYIDLNIFKRFKKALIIICLLEFIVTLVQRSYAATPYGGRLYGTFIYPGPFALFMCFMLCLQLGDDLSRYKRIRKRSILFYFLSLYFILLTASGTGIIGILIISLVYFIVYYKMNQNIKKILLPFLLILPIILYLCLPLITGRAQIGKSGMIRISIFSEMFSSFGPKEILIGRYLGHGSNAAALVKVFNIVPITVPLSEEDQVFVADSFYTSLVAQVGVVFVVCYVVFLINLFIKAIRNKYNGINPAIVFVIPMLLIISYTGNVIEMFPINWLLFILCGIALRENTIKTEGNKLIVLETGTMDAKVVGA
jgi:hypothetical protein